MFDFITTLFAIEVSVILAFFTKCRS